MRERSTIGGYQIVKRIGSGGMSTVYKAVDGDGREVALKLLHPEVAADPAARDRLRREVRMLQRVHGEYVAQILDAETEEAEVFIVTQLIDGPTLDADVRDSGRYEGSDLVELGEELAAALRSIHDVGVLHRDLKPSNVMMGADGPVLIDFGIAQLGDDLRMTRTGSLTHTPGWADPRVIRGAAPDEMADWWSLSAVLAYAATGTVPYKAETTPAVMHRVLSGEPRLPGLSPEVEQAFRLALDPDGARRITFDALVEALDTTTAVGPVVIGTSVDGVGTPVTGRGQDTLEEELEDYDFGDDGEVGADTIVAPVGDDHRIDDDEWDLPAMDADSTRPIDMETGRATAPYGVDSTRMQTRPGPTNYPSESYAPPGGEGMPAYARDAPTSQMPPTGPERRSVFDRQEIGEPQQVEHTRELLPVGQSGYLPPSDYPVAPFNPAQPGRLPDWFRPARKARLHVLLVGVIIAIFSLMWPMQAALVFAGLVALVSIIGGADRGLKDRRVAHGGPFKGDLGGALVRLPLTIVGALVRSAISLGAGAVVAWLTIAGLEAFALTPPELYEPIGLALGMIVAWFVGSNRNGREGARIVMEGIGPTAGYRLFWLAILLVVAMAGVIVVGQSGSSII